MRPIIDDYLYYNDTEAYLLVADMGNFPKMQTTYRYVDVGLSETLLVNTALGLALSGKRVYIYSVSNFVLYRAWEQIKLHFESNTCRGFSDVSIVLLTGGAGFCYSACGLGHFLVDDIALLRSHCPSIRMRFPYDSRTTLEALESSKVNSITYIRLCMDNAEDYVESDNIADLYVATLGWLVPIVDKLCKEIRLCYNDTKTVRVIPIDTLPSTKVIPGNYVSIYDNIHLSDMDVLSAPLYGSCLGTHCISFPITDCMSNNRYDVLRHYRFDDKSLVQFLLPFIYLQ